MNAIKLTLSMVAILGLAALAASPAMAQPIEWNGNVSTDWHNGANWDGGNVPDGDDDVLIAAGFIVVISTDDAACKTLDIKSGLRLEITGKALTLGDSSATTTSNLDTGKPGPAIIRFVKSGIVPGVLKVHNTVTFTGGGTIDAPGAAYLGRIERASGSGGIFVDDDIDVIGNITFWCDVTNDSTDRFGANDGQTMVFGKAAGGINVEVSGTGEFYAQGKIQFTIVSFGGTAPKWIIQGGEIEVTDDAGSTYWDDLPFDVELRIKDGLLDLQHDFTCNGKLTVSIDDDGPTLTITVASGKVARFEP